ncbi:DMT family transporter [Ramlibacter rhizophilus]|uniref:DMT family transporter n=1 Tax=Ramlibacter rhizophilus TaxID=1781167 RepID=A0A4Z0BK75_9BURK|nr:DMT family transporter [Ramlibacter rhizophilus]TFY98514.1 DMT family transporter [Ramlibacter rhizophilus]
MSSVSPQADRNELLLRSMPAVFVLIWATGFVVARFGMPHAPPMKFLAVRYILSVACFLVWAGLARASWPVGRRQWLHLSVTGVLMHAGYLGGVWAAVKTGMGAGLAALLVGLQPVLTALWISWGGGRISSRQWTGLALGLGGLVLVVWQKLGLGEVHALNLLFATVALLSITAGTLYQKRFVQACDVRTANGVQLAAAFVVTLPLALLETESMRWFLPGGGLNPELAGAMGWSVLALTLGGSSLLYLLIQRGVATSVTSLMYLVPPTTALMAWVLFDEPITALTIAGVALTATGVSLVVRTPATDSLRKGSA